MSAQREILLPIFEKWYEQNAKLSKKGHGSGDQSKTGNSIFFHGGNLETMSEDDIRKIMDNYSNDVNWRIDGNAANQLGRTQVWIHGIDTNDKDIDWNRYINGKPR